jgi:hypothetical protein
MDDGRLLPCAECGSEGLLQFERGPAVEPCRACSGTGRTYTGERYRGVFAAMIDEKGTFLDRDIRLLLVGLDALDRRVSELEPQGEGPG